jgi:hypothetical protein
MLWVVFEIFWNSWVVVQIYEKFWLVIQIFTVHYIINERNKTDREIHQTAALQQPQSPKHQEHISSIPQLTWSGRSLRVPAADETWTWLGPWACHVVKRRHSGLCSNRAWVDSYVGSYAGSTYPLYFTVRILPICWSPDLQSEMSLGAQCPFPALSS